MGEGETKHVYKRWKSLFEKENPFSKYWLPGPIGRRLPPLTARKGKGEKWENKRIERHHFHAVLGLDHRNLSSSLHHSLRQCALSSQIDTLLSQLHRDVIDSGQKNNFCAVKKQASAARLRLQFLDWERRGERKRNFRRMFTPNQYLRRDLPAPPHWAPEEQ